MTTVVKALCTCIFKYYGCIHTYTMIIIIIIFNIYDIIMNISLPIALPSVVITVTVILCDTGIVRFSVNTNVSWPSIVETDDVWKHIIDATIGGKY